MNQRDINIYMPYPLNPLIISEVKTSPGKHTLVKINATYFLVLILPTITCYAWWTHWTHQAVGNHVLCALQISAYSFLVPPSYYRGRGSILDGFPYVVVMTIWQCNGFSIPLEMTNGTQSYPVFISYSRTYIHHASRPHGPSCAVKNGTVLPLAL